MDGRTKFVVSWMVILFIFAWVMALSDKLGVRFWDTEYALKKVEKMPTLPSFHNNTWVADLFNSYYTHRYFVFFPHVLFSFFWWNLYFLQLIPAVRRWSLPFHRLLGKFLMVVAILQGISGGGLAYTSGSSTIKIVSYSLSTSVIYCVWKAWMFAHRRDIPRHKYWSIRLVGYLQSIALQRFFMFLFIATHQLGWYGFYPDLKDATVDTVNRVLTQLFDDTFVSCVITAILGVARNTIRSTRRIVIVLGLNLNK